MDTLNARQILILRSLVDNYVRFAQPVGSGTLARAGKLKLSSATIRNEMSDLEDMGYITHPHTSAGRVPTDKGYRLYVDMISGENIVDRALAEAVMRSYSRKIEDLDQLIGFTSRILSYLSEQAAVVIYPEPETLYFERASLVFVDSAHVLVTWMSRSGVTGHRLIETKITLTVSLCQKVNALINNELKGIKLSDLESTLLSKLLDSRDALHKLYELAKYIVKKSITPALPEMRLDGSDHIFEQPEFQDLEILKRILRVLKTGEDDLRKAVCGMGRDLGIRVHIGEENPKAMRECSVVVAPYLRDGAAIGSMALVGPRRMPYRRMISIMHYVSACFSERFNQL